MSRSYVIHQLDGYTDGRESWRRVRVPFNNYSREAAEEVLQELQRLHPNGKFRVRMKPTK